MGFSVWRSDNNKPMSLYERMCNTCLSAVVGIMLFAASFVIQFIFHESVKSMSTDAGKGKTAAKESNEVKYKGPTTTI